MRKFALAVFACSLAVFLFPALSSNSASEPTKTVTNEVTMRIYFIPFGTRFFVPVGIGDIEKRSHINLWFIRRGPILSEEHPFVQKLSQVLQSQRGTAEIDHQGIRLKVEFGTDTFYADNAGAIRKQNTGEKFWLSLVQLDSLEKEIEYFAGVVDIKASKKVAIPN